MAFSFLWASQASGILTSFFSARNGGYIQLLRLRRMKGQWLQATRVSVGEKVVLEKVDEGFPEHELDWNSKKAPEEPVLPKDVTGTTMAVELECNQENSWPILVCPRCE